MKRNIIKAKQVKIRVVTNARKNEVQETEGLLKVYVNAPPVDNKANKAIIKLLAEHFQSKKGNIKIIRGEKSKEKIIEII